MAQQNRPIKLKKLSANSHELCNGKYDILFSYETPVAYYDPEEDVIYQSKENYSATTTKHIRGWLDQDSRWVMTSQKLIEQAVLKV